MNRTADYVIRATVVEGQIRAFVATTRDLVEQVRISHNTSPVVTAALGRPLTVGVMMGCDMKGEDDFFTLKIQGGGLIGGLTVTADSRGNVKGYAFSPTVMLPPNEKEKPDVGGALGMGVLSVIKDTGLKESYTGQIILVIEEIAEDLTYYYATSEQTPSSVTLGVLTNKDNTVHQPGGFIIQLIPGASEDIIGRLENELKEISSIITLLDAGNTPEMILEYVLGEFGLGTGGRLPAAFYCNCTKDRAEKALISVGRKDTQEMMEDGRPIEVNCHFRSKNYTSSVDELKDMLKKARQGARAEISCEHNRFFKEITIRASHRTGSHL